MKHKTKKKAHNKPLNYNKL